MVLSEVGAKSPKSRPPKGVIQNDPNLFAGVRFFIHDTIAPKLRAKLHAYIVSHGGAPCKIPPLSSSPRRRFDDKDLTHFITDTFDFPERLTLQLEPTSVSDEADKSVKIVSPTWVTRSGDLQKLEPTRFHSPDKSLYFSGFVFCVSELPDLDRTAIQAGVSSLGGAFRKELTREVTHLFVVAEQGEKYNAALKYGPDLGMVIVLPHWFEECLRLGQLIGTDIYTFPNPVLLDLMANTGSPKSFEERLSDWYKLNPQGRLPKPRTMTYTLLQQPARSSLDTYQRTAVIQCERENVVQDLRGAGAGSGLFALDSMATHSSSMQQQAPKKAWPQAVSLAAADQPIFKNRKVYLASDLGLRPNLEKSLKERVQEAGGTCWSWGVDGAEVIQDSEGDQWERRRRAEKALVEADTVVTRTREGWEFWTAYEEGKMIGNLAWMFHVFASSKLDSPLDHILHYPLPVGPIPGFENCLMTISNYAGLTRDYVRTLIETCGSKFDGVMTKNTAYVVSASDYGAKARQSKSWNIPCVTHLWLEACILSWTIVDPMLSPRYSACSTSKTNFSPILGTSPFPRGAIDKWAESEEAKLAKAQALEPMPERAMEVEEEEGGGGEGEGGGRGEGEGGGEPGSEEPMEEDEEESEEVEAAPLTDGKRREEEMAVDKAEEEEDEDEESEVVQARLPKGKGREKVVKKPVPAPEEDDDDSSDSPVIVEEPKGKGESVAVDKAAKAKAAILMDEDDDDDYVEILPVAGPSSPSKHLATPAKTKPTPPPHRYEASAEASSSRKPIASSSRKPPIPSSSVAPPSSRKPDLPSSASRARGVDSDNILPKRAPRAAASSAVAALHKNMADANAFALEQSSAKKRKRGSSQVRPQEEEEEEDEEDEAPAPARKGRAKEVKPKVAAKKTVPGRSGADSTQDGVVSSFDNPPNPKKSRVAGVSEKPLRVISTGLGLDKNSPEFKELAKLGCKWTDTVSQATVLVVPKILRTEKFLSCLAFAPKIVGKSWVDACLKAKKLVDEDKYLIRDVEKEKALGDTLVNILERARQHKLFEGYTIYLTKGLKPDAGTCQRVVQCGGGIVSTVKLSSVHEQIAKNEMAFVVSSPEDRREWEQLAAKTRVKIFSVEAVFESIAIQQLRFVDKHRIDQQIDR